jgi:DNA-binding CsgD family transcriptional regulator
VNARGNVVHANASARTLIEDGDVIRLTSGTLAGVDGVADRSLREALVAAGGLEAELAGRGIGISLTGSSGKSYMAHVLPLASGRRREAALSQGAVAAIFVRKAALDLTTPAEIMVERYRLTPAELKVFRAAVEVGGVATVAAALAMSEATVKTHLNRLFHKTGTRRQADLVRLATSLADPRGR